MVRVRARSERNAAHVHISCSSRLFLLNGMCLDSCPSGTVAHSGTSTLAASTASYRSLTPPLAVSLAPPLDTKTCAPCGPGEATCSITGATTCTTIAQGTGRVQTFLNSANPNAKTCVVASQCPARTYATTTGRKSSEPFAIMKHLTLSLLHQPRSSALRVLLAPSLALPVPDLRQSATTLLSFLTDGASPSKLATICPTWCSTVRRIAVFVFSPCRLAASLRPLTRSFFAHSARSNMRLPL